jgi:dihydroorotase
VGRTLSLLKFADMHVHLRDPDIAQGVAPYTAGTCARALVMPNTTVPLTTADLVRRYADSLPLGCEYSFLAYLTPAMTPADIFALRGVAIGTKLYPAGLTTHSGHGIPRSLLREPSYFDDVFAAHVKVDLSFHVHPEMPGSFVMDSEADFIPFLAYAARKFPRLRIVVEHVTSAAMVRWVTDTPQALATITPQHLAYDLGSLFEDGLRPHRYCKPVYKTPADRASLWKAVLHERFMLGSDSAPHAIGKKEAPCGCAGVWSAPVLAPVLTHLFDGCGLLHVLPDFTRLRAEKFWDKCGDDSTVELEEKPYRVPDQVHCMPPLYAGETLDWRVA